MIPIDVVLWNSLVEYSEDSPSGLRWKVQRYGVKCGDVVGCKNDRGYWNVKYNKKSYKVHRLILAISLDTTLENCFVDHLNGDVSDNNINNLRIVTHEENMHNLKKYSNNSTGKTGVVFRAGRSPRYIAHWRDSSGNLHTKSFSLSVYGAESYEMASNFRSKMIAELEGYTDRHGE